ncbi:MAG: efflux RND transporter periplasmic adaptor subunit [Desulfobacterales bacterium]
MIPAGNHPAGGHIKAKTFFSCIAALIFITWLPAAANAADEDCVPVKTATVETMDLERKVRAIGTLEAIQRVMIRPEVAGSMEAVHFQEGSRVEKGELLFSMDDDKIQERLKARQAALEEARANLENAELVYNRRQRLYKQDLGTAEARDEARARYKALLASIDRIKAEIEGIKETLADTQIKAPFAGIIGEQRVDPGEWVDVGTPLAPLVETDRLKIAFTIAERHLGQAKPGQTLNLRAPAFPDKTFTGEVYYVSPLIREDTRSLMVKAYVENPDLMLAPGGFAAVDLIVETFEQRPVIPEEALVPTRTGYLVYVVEDDQAIGRDVEIGLRQPGIAEIRKGINPGETIIQSGHISVSDGDTVCPQK